MSRLSDFVEVVRHKKAFFTTRNNNPVLRRQVSVLTCLLHDSGKAANILLLGDKAATAIHRRVAGHHRLTRTAHLWEAITDWECARVTKPSKPLDARGTWGKYYNYLPIGPLLDEAGL